MQVLREILKKNKEMLEIKCEIEKMDKLYTPINSGCSTSTELDTYFSEHGYEANYYGFQQALPITIPD